MLSGFKLRTQGVATFSAVVDNWTTGRARETMLIALLVGMLAACHHDVRPASAPASTPRSSLALKISGDPESAAGATWTLTGTLESTSVDLQGILLNRTARDLFRLSC